MTTEVADAESLIAIAESERVCLMVGHTFIYNAGIEKLKECVDRSPGRVYYMHSCRTNLGPIRRDVNALWDLATHDVAIFNHLMSGGPEWVSAVGSKVLCNRNEDVGFISLGYAGDVIAHIHVSWADPNKAREITIVCSDRRIVFDDLNPIEQVRIFEKGISPVVNDHLTYGEYALQIRDGDIVSPKIQVREPLKTECRHFLDCVRDGQRPLSSGWEGREVVKVLRAIDRSVALSGARVEVESREVREATVAERASVALSGG
jgi:predicted dehydrogenase